MAEHRLRLRYRYRQRCRGVAGRDVDVLGVLRAWFTSRAVAVLAGNVTQGARGRVMGGPAVTRTRRARGARRAHGRSRAAVRRRLARPRARDSERGRGQSGARVVWLARSHARDHRQDSGRRHLLVWRHRMAGTDRHADQRLLVDDDRRRCGGEPRGDRPCRTRMHGSGSMHTPFSCAAARASDSAAPINIPPLARPP